ncbi:MAG: hypothetical protein N0A00_02005, partial [Candidatus Bathyarchaeota archaeon]|nr:hypothetical protein [Candidatus Bathyarchaeota archaeon]
AFKEVISSLPPNIKRMVVAFVKNEFHSYYTGILRGLPLPVKEEYETKYNQAGPEEVVQIFKCLQCNSLNVLTANIFELIEEREIKCEKCGYKMPLKLCLDNEFLKTFVRWAQESFISRNLMPMLIKLQEGMSLITCDVKVYRNIIVKGSAPKITGRIIPPHPLQEVTLTLVDPKGNKSESKVSTDINGVYALEQRFDECGEWKICASWRGDEDHYCSTSKEITVLVFEFS